MKKLKNSQQVIYEFIISFYEEHSYPPTVREICKAVGLSSTSTVHAHLTKLEQRGLISHKPSKQRSIVVNRPQSSAEAQPVPLVGNVAAGLPILAVENIETVLPLPRELLHGASKDEVFLLRLTGDSMIDIGMFTNDYIIVHNGLDYTDGDIVVARVEGEAATVKRIFREQGRVRLQPENANMEPIYTSYEGLTIVGKVIGLIRSY